jgi:hypothetical protein
MAEILTLSAVAALALLITFADRIQAARVRRYLRNRHPLEVALDRFADGDHTAVRLEPDWKAF